VWDLGDCYIELVSSILLKLLLNEKKEDEYSGVYFKWTDSAR
jgi:hypothetical protein